MIFRDLTAAEIEVRVGQVKEGKGCSLLLYKDARCDMNILDETVGPENWQREHYECKGNLFCRVGVNVNYAKREYSDVDPEWVYKSDCGTESNTEAEKGESSDSFKRACVNWGIGRELYTSPFIWIGLNGVNLNGKKTYDKFSVKSITIKDKKIVQLEIQNDTLGITVFTWEKGKLTTLPKNTPNADVDTNALKEQNNVYVKTIHSITGETIESIQREAVKRAGSKDAEKVNNALAQWLVELNK